MNLLWDLCSKLKIRTLPSLVAYVHDNHNNENISLDTHNVGIMTQVWHYGTGVVLDSNSLRWKIIVQALRMKEKEVYAGFL